MPFAQNSRGKSMLYESMQEVPNHAAADGNFFATKNK